MVKSQVLNNSCDKEMCRIWQLTDPEIGFSHFHHGPTECRKFQVCDIKGEKHALGRLDSLHMRNVLSEILGLNSLCSRNREWHAT
jgi:hypothetical protein